MSGRQMPEDMGKSSVTTYSNSPFPASHRKREAGAGSGSGKQCPAFKNLSHLAFARNLRSDSSSDVAVYPSICEPPA